MKNAVILLSGDLDSTTVLAIAKDEGFTPYALSFRYGQHHLVELESAQRVAQALGVAEGRRAERRRRFRHLDGRKMADRPAGIRPARAGRRRPSTRRPLAWMARSGILVPATVP